MVGGWRWPPIPSSDEVKESVKLYLFYPSEPSWSVLGWPLPLPLHFKWINLSDVLTQACLLHTYTYVSQDNIICWLTGIWGGKPNNCGHIFSKIKVYYLLGSVQTGFGPPPSFHSVGTEGFCQRVSGRSLNLSSPAPRSEVEIEFDSTSTSPHAFMAWRGAPLPLPLYTHRPKYQYNVIAESFIFMKFSSQISALTTRIMSEGSCPSWQISGKVSNLAAIATFSRLSFRYALIIMLFEDVRVGINP
jgi:hypothetical protein